MSTEQKLTKKQRKGVAFRQRKGKGRPDAPGGDVPEREDIDAEGLDEDEPRQGAGKALSEQARPPTKKRKRSEETAGDRDDGKEKAQPANANTKKKRKTVSKEAEKEEKGEEHKAEPQEDGKKPVKSRFILFVGNLKYTTSKDAIQQHFAACDPPPSVRLLTPKTPSTSKSKGCAFLEFTHRNALQQGLKLHQSTLDGRQINVELTAGGGGKGENRLNKVKQRNRDLASQRTKLQQKDADGKPVDDVPERPQRHSTTSGAEVIQPKKRTWTITDADDGEKHRGGKKHAKSDKKRGGRRPKDQGTGVNAIPVG